MKVVNKKIMAGIIALLVVIEACTLFLMYKSLGNKETNLENVLLNKKGEMIAILLEQEDGTYEESETWPNEGYEYDSIKSGCMDENGNKIEGILQYDRETKIATVETGKTSYCYLYFYKVIDIESQTFNYTGNYQEYTVEANGYYLIETYGASGGAMGSYTGGMGGYSSGYIYLTKGEKLYIYVGGAGNSTAGGYNGGVTNSNPGLFGVTGGGATDVRYFGSTTPTENDLIWNSNLGLNSRIMVAGAGGGANVRGEGYGEGNGGVGGTLIGGKGTSTNNGNAYGYGIGTGGTQNNGGQLYWVEKGSGERPTGYYNNGYFGTSYVDQSGAGAGYYGGGSAGHGGAGGGSSFISGYAGSNAITSSSDTANPRTHSNNTIHYSGKYFIKGTMQAGVNSGNGKAVISYYGRTFEKTNDILDNVRYIKDCINGNSVNVSNHWVELQAIKDGKNIAKEKTVTGTFEPLISDSNQLPLNSLVDGIINEVNYINNAQNLNCVIVDLGSVNNLDEIAVWHYFSDGRGYNNHSLYVSEDNSNWTTLIDNQSGVVETANGTRIQNR